MTIGTSTSRVSFNCDSVSTVFPVPIQAYLAADFTVILTAPASAGGGQVVLVLNSTYMLIPSGTLAPTAWTLTTIPVYATGYTLQVFCNPTQTQQTSYVQGQAFPSLAVQTNLDRLTQMVQRLQDEVNRSVRAPDGDVSPAMLLPIASARGNSTLITDANGNIIVGTPTTSVISIGTVSPLIHYNITPGETAAGVNPADLGYAPGVVDRYGVNSSPGSTNMAAAVSAAFAVAKAQGGGSVTFLQGGNYYLGTVTGDGKAAPLLSVTGLANCTVYGNGATITTNTTAFVVGAVLGFINPSNLCFYDLNFYDTGFDQSQQGVPNFKCAQSIFVTSTGSLNYSGITLVNCQASHTGSLFGAWQNSNTSRITNIGILGCRALNCFYGANFQQQGDDVTIAGFYVLNPARAYFPYGVAGHSVDITVTNDGTNVNAGSNALCDIKRYDYDTKEIKLRLTYHGLSSIYGALVNLETNVTSNAPAIFDGIDIDLRLADSTVTGSSVGFPVQLRDVSSGSVAATTSTQWKRISLRGDVGSWPAGNINNPISIASVPNVTRGQLSLGQDFYDVTPATPQIFPGFAVRTKANSSVHTMLGNLTAANSGATDARTINMSSYTGTLFCLRVTLYAEADYTIGSTQQCYRRYLIFGHNTAGTVTIQSTNIEATYDAGSASTVTVSATGNFIQFALTVYSGSNAQLRLETEHLGKFL